MSLLSGRLAMITGGSSGIGLEIALGLAKESVRLLLVGRDRSRLDSVAAQARDAGAPETQIIRADLGDDAAVEELGRALDREAGLDLLIHSAGVVQLSTVADASLADLDAQYRINLRAPFALTQRCLPQLKRARGQIVFINSGAGLNARAGWSQYATTKFGLKALADSLREEVQADGVRVLSVFPGRTATPMQEAVHKMERKSYDPSRFISAASVATMVVRALDQPPSAHVVDIVIRPGG